MIETGLSLSIYIKLCYEPVSTLSYSVQFSIIVEGVQLHKYFDRTRDVMRQAGSSKRSSVRAPVQPATKEN